MGRKGNYRKQKNLIVIVSHGLETEPIYFKHFNKEDGAFVLKISQQRGLTNQLDEICKISERRS